MYTLVVNYSYEPIEVVSWEKAIYLLVTQKAELLVAYDKLVRSVSLTLQLPKVVRLKRYVKLKLRNRGVYRKRDVFERDGWACVYCQIELDSKTATLDHVVPSSKGGKTTFENTVAACQRCNSFKANRTPAEAGMVLRKVPQKPELSQAMRPDLQRAYDSFMGSRD